MSYLIPSLYDWRDDGEPHVPPSRAWVLQGMGSVYLYLPGDHVRSDGHRIVTLGTRKKLGRRPTSWLRDLTPPNDSGEILCEYVVDHHHVPRPGLYYLHDGELHSVTGRPAFPPDRSVSTLRLYFKREPQVHGVVFYVNAQMLAKVTREEMLERATSA